jgi:hypothetical protein
MSDKPPAAERARIIVGSPLPFSVFGAEGQLLLAEGTVVESDYTRLMLLRNGVYRDAAELPRDAHQNCVTAAGDDQAPLLALRKDYGAASIGRRFALSIAAGDAGESHTAWVIGVHNGNILLTAPRQPNGSLLGVKVGQAWICRAFQMTSAFRFRSAVLKVVFEPFPQVLIEAPQHVERRTIRSRPRAAVFVPITLEAPQPMAGIMVDLSASGGRLALAEGVEFKRGHGLRIALKLELIDSTFELSLNAKVVAVFGASDGRHPRVHFYGIRFEAPTELERLVLHGYVSGQLAMELNSLWQLLSAAVPVNTEAAAGTGRQNQ